MAKSVKESISPIDKVDAYLSNVEPEKVQRAPGMLTEGTTVSINKTVLSGVVSGYHLSDDKKTFSYLVSYTEDGEAHERGFTHDQLTEITNETK